MTHLPKYVTYAHYYLLHEYYYTFLKGRKSRKIFRAQSFTSLMADGRQRHKEVFLHLAGAIMEYFIEDSALLRL